MRYWMRLLGALGAVFLLAVLPGCALDPARAKAGSAEEINERLSQVISRAGFTHGLRSQHKGYSHVDSIYIQVPLDSLKRRHYSLETLIKDVGKVCSLPQYSAYPIQIDVGAGDEPDRLYLEAELLKWVGGKPNIKVFVEPDTYNDILITIAHPETKWR